MIKRYTRPEMGRIWTDENEFQTMLDIEIYACEIMAELGQIPAAAGTTGPTAFSIRTALPGAKTSSS